MAADWIGFSYAALVTAGGIIGYGKAGKHERHTDTFGNLVFPQSWCVMFDVLQGLCYVVT